MRSELRLALTLTLFPRRGNQPWAVPRKSLNGEHSPAVENLLPLHEPERRLPARRGDTGILERAVPEAGAAIPRFSGPMREISFRGILSLGESWGEGGREFKLNRYG